MCMFVCVCVCVCEHACGRGRGGVAKDDPLKKKMSDLFA